MSYIISAFAIKNVLLYILLLRETNSIHRKYYIYIHYTLYFIGSSPKYIEISLKRCTLPGGCKNNLYERIETQKQMHFVE